MWKIISSKLFRQVIWKKFNKHKKLNIEMEFYRICLGWIHDLMTTSGQVRKERGWKRRINLITGCTITLKKVIRILSSSKRLRVRNWNGCRNWRRTSRPTMTQSVRRTSNQEITCSFCYTNQLYMNITEYMSV